MTLQRPLYMQAQSGDAAMPYAAIATRQDYDTTYATEGVINLGLQVTQRGAGANMSVDVAAGACVIQGDDVAGQGKYKCVNDAGAFNVTVPAAPASGTRVHRVVARIKDKLHSGSWTTYEWTAELLADTGSGTPALPNSAISLARVSVTAGQVSVLTANITDDRVNALLNSSRPLLVSSNAGRPPNPQQAEEWWRTDLNAWEFWSGTNFLLDQPIPAAILRQSVTQSFTTATLAPLTFDTEDYDSHNGHSTSSNTSRYVIPTGWGGIWRVAANVVWAASTGGSRETRISVNGTNRTMVGRYQPGNSSVCTVSGTSLISVSAGDYVELNCQQDSGSSLSTSANNSAAASTMSIEFVRPLNG